jgi:hypothetical protein
VDEVERPKVNPKGIAKPVPKRQPLRAPLPGQTNTPVAPAAEPVETVEETAMSANAPATEEVTTTPPETTDDEAQKA